MLCEKRYVMTNTRFTAIIAATIVIVGIFYTATIREGHNWGDDFSMYIRHAKNIVEGIRYENTGYILDPQFATVGPETYPPVFPLLLAPIYKYFGLNFTAMKMEIILFFLLSLAALYFLFRDELPFSYTLALIAVIGFSPLFWYLKDQVLSETPFMFFCYVSLLSIKRVYQSPNFKRWGNIKALIIAAVLYLSYGTRAIGILFLPSLLIYDVLKFKKPSLLAIKVSLLFLIIIVLQNIFLHSEGGYLYTFKTFSWNLDNILHSFHNFGKTLGFIPMKLSTAVASIAAAIIFAALVLYGIYSKIRDNLSCTEIFLLVYVICLIPWVIVIHGRGLRYLVPMVPLSMFYILKGLSSFKLMSAKIKATLFIGCLGVVLISYVYFYAHTNYGPINPDITNVHSSNFFEYIKDNTDPEAVFISKKPRALALFTDRKASIYPSICNEKLYWDYFKRIRASYLVLGPVDEVYFYKVKLRDKFFVKFLIKYRECLTQVYANPNFRVYKINHLPDE
jgi:hypothetical protein